MTEPKRYYLAESGVVFGPDSPDVVPNVTPVVVLDPSNEADAQRLSDALYACGYGLNVTEAGRILDALLPPEPVTEPGGGAWAVAKDRDGDVWLRGEDGLWWHGDLALDWAGLVRDYSPLTVLREGVETDE